MFDIGFSELIIVFVVGLLILGPERLPHAAKTAGLWVRKIRRSINSVQREINAQLDQEELQQKINETNQRILKEGQNLQNTMTESHGQQTMVEAPDAPIMTDTGTENTQFPTDDGLEPDKKPLTDAQKSTPETTSRS